jgi:hypothetical protein
MGQRRNTDRDFPLRSLLILKIFSGCSFKASKEDFKIRLRAMRVLGGPIGGEWAKWTIWLGALLICLQDLKEVGRLKKYLEGLLALLSYIQQILEVHLADNKDKVVQRDVTLKEISPMNSIMRKYK